MTTMKFTRTHEWLREKDETVVIGITDHAQALLGDMVFIELPAIGSTVAAGDELGVLESVKAASDFYAPVSGEVLEVNSDLLDNPALVNQEPYGEGWLVKMRMTNPQELTTLLNKKEYDADITEN